MPAELVFNYDLLGGFLLTLTRVSAALFLLPIPGWQTAPPPARIVFAVSFTLCLFSQWSFLGANAAAAGWVLALLFEAATGLLIGLTIALVFEAFQVGAQAISSHAGFSFATTFDPQSQADSGVLLIFAQLATGLIFFSLGVHEHLLRLLAYSFEAMHLSPGQTRELTLSVVLRLGGRMFAEGFKLALPVVVLLFLVDQALAAISRLHAQLQLLHLAFPAKIVLSTIVFALLLNRWPTLFEKLTTTAFGTVSHLLPQH